ncbi:hypothetical protein C0U40_17155 [Amylibacter cionae]|nr:hypothetical protein C0U40_17155 [Amylibacter cionae]
MVFGGVGNDTIKGQNGADILDGDDDDDYIHAGNGDDIVRGGSGNDELRGGHGDDRVTGGDGDDEIHGGTGKDRIYGGDGDDDIYGGYGKDRIQGGDGDDIIAGGYGGDDILGGDGADSIRGGRGRDTIKGGDGDDIIAGGAHDDTLFGGDGYDVAVYGGSIYDYSWTTSGNKVTVVDNSTRNGDSGTDVLQQIEVLRFNDGEVLLGKTNNAPVVTAENVSVSEGGTVGFTVTGVDFDKDTMSVFDVVYTGSGDYSITGFTNTLNSNHSEFVASVSFATSGGFEALAFGESTVEQIVFTLTDGNGGFTSKTVEITITGENDDPVAQAGTVSGDEDTVISGSVAATDVDGDTLTFALATDGSNGSVILAADGSYTYTPAADFNGTDSFTYTVSDGNGGTDTQTVNITVNAVNDAPVAQAAMASGDEDTVISGTVAATDVDGDTLTFALATDGTNGSVVMAADGSYAYTPDADFNGTDSFTYTVSDGNGGTDTQTVNIRVDAVNDAPVAQAGTASGDEDTVISGMLLASDVDGDTLRYAVETQATHGTVAIRPDGSYAYTPGADFNGTDSFTYTVSDGNGGTDTQTVNITVNAVNDAPVAQAGMASGDEDTVISGTVAASDVDGDTLTFALATDGSNGSVVMAADGSYAYTPDADFNGTDSFTYTVSDGNGGTDTQTVNIRVDAVNDAPVAQAGTASGDEDTVISGTLLASDVDGDTLRFAVETQATHGTVAIRPDGSYAYTPGADFNGSDSFTYTVSDGNGGTDTQTINITVNAVNDAPEGLTAELAVDEDGTITGMLVAQDIDGDSLTFALDTAASNGVVTVSADGSFSYTPTADYFGTDSFAYSVDDGNGGVVSKTVLIDVASVNDAPVQTAPVPDQLVTENGGTASVDLSSFVSDLETANLSFSTVSLVDSSTGRSVAIGTSFTGGVLSFNPSELDLALGDTFDGVFTIRVDDGSGAANSTTQISFNLTVNGSNDPTPINTNNAPVAADLVLRKGDIDPIVIDLKELATDADGGDVLSFGNIVISGSGREGSVTYSLSDGVLIIDPAQFNIEPDETTGVAPEVELEISFDVNDGAGKANSVDTGTILLTIEDGAGPVEEPDTPNNQPVFTNTIVNEAATDRNIVIDLSEYASDADLDDLSFTVSITGGTDLDYELRGTTLHIAYTDTDITGLGAGDSISTEFTVTVDDNTGSANATNTGTVTVNIDGPFTPSPAENRAPVISGPIYGLEVVTDGYDLVTYRESGSDLVEIGRTHVVGTIVTFDLDDFASDADADAISFSDVSVTIGGAEAGGSPNTISSSFDPATNVLTFDIADLGLSDGEELPVSMNFTVTDDSGAENASTTGSITVAASDPADAAAATTTFDFEEYSSESGSTISIGGVDGFVFSGSTSVFETDEPSLDPERPNPVGLANGQVSFEGDNVLVANVDGTGENFAVYADDATQRIGNEPLFLNSFPPGFAHIFDPDSYGFGGEFNLENVSINPVSSDNVTIRIVSYRAEIVEVPNGSNSDYYADYVEVDSFDFIVDASTVATSIDFSNTLFDDPSVDYDSKFDGINAVEIYALDGSSVVIDDLSLTPV